MQLLLNRSRLGAGHCPRRAECKYSTEYTYFQGVMTFYPLAQPLANDALFRAICGYYFISMSSLHLTSAFHGYLPHQAAIRALLIFCSRALCDPFRCTTGHFAPSDRHSPALTEEHPTGTRTYKNCLQWIFIATRRQCGGGSGSGPSAAPLCRAVYTRLNGTSGWKSYFYYRFHGHYSTINMSKMSASWIGKRQKSGEISTSALI